MKIDDRIETLTQLGLTLNQARAYLTLVQIGSAGASKISQISKITRQDIYRVMPTLEKTGITQRTIGKPTIYKAIPIRQATQILLTRKTEEQKQLLKKTKELIQHLENKDEQKENTQETAQFTIISGKINIIQKIGETLCETQKTLDVVTSKQRFESAIQEFKKKYEFAVKRGVKIRIAAEKHVVQNGLSEILQKLAENKRFQIRYFIGAPEAVVSIFDKTRVSLTLSETANLPGASALLSNEKSLVALIQNYFENKWNNSAK